MAKFIFAGSLNIFVPFLVPVDKKIHNTKFEIEEENTIANSEKTAFVTPSFFRLLKDRLDKDRL